MSKGCLKKTACRFAGESDNSAVLKNCDRERLVIVCLFVCGFWFVGCYFYFVLYVKEKQ